MSEGVLYISYDGMLEPLGQSQVLAYLERLALGRRIHLISFEKASDWQESTRRDEISKRIAHAGITWHPLRYHKNPTAPATAYDIAAGTARAIVIARSNGVKIVHARSYVAALIGLAVKRVTGAKFLFDMRGFWADERVEGGLWHKDGSLYRAAKALERRFLLAADHVVTLTNAAKNEIGSFDYLQGRVPPISVVPTCADLDRFTIQGPPQREPFTLGYVGSVGTCYSLDGVLECFSMLREFRTDARLLIVNRGEHEQIRERARRMYIDPSAMEIVAADHQDVPRHIARMTAGAALYKPGYSRLACAPTKLAEYLGCGVPCVGDAGVGDMADVLEGRHTGIAISIFGERPTEFNMRRLLELTEEPGLQRRCRNVAQELFSLDGGVGSYDSIYEELGAKSSAERQFARQH